MEEQRRARGTGFIGDGLQAKGKGFIGDGLRAKGKGYIGDERRVMGGGIVGDGSRTTKEGFVSDGRQNQAYPQTSVSPEDFSSAIEDVRSSPFEDGEIILNLWYVANRIVISSLRAKTYVASGSDDEKLRFLQMRANRDFRNAQVYPVPENLKVDVILADRSTEAELGKACTHANLEFMGGFPALFREIILNVPKAGFGFDPNQAMMCITRLEEGPDGELSVRIDKKTSQL